MRTEDLVRVLSTNHEPVKSGRLRNALAAALVIGGVAALCLMLATVGPRPDIATGAHLSFLAFKLAFTVSVVAIGAVFLLRSMFPGRPESRKFVVIFLPLAAIAVIGVTALLLTDMRDWGGMLIGTGWAACLICIPFFAVIPFGALVWALRKGAPTHLRRTGAAVGLVAGALGAAAYAFHCPDDSLPFVAIWYGGPVVALAIVGAILGHRLLRW